MSNAHCQAWECGSESPDTGGHPRDTLVSRGEWSGQCSINKQHSLKPPGPQESGGRWLAETGSRSSDCHMGQKGETPDLPSARHRHPLWGREGQGLALRTGPAQPHSVRNRAASCSALGQTSGRKLQCPSAADWTVRRVPSSTTCPGPPWAAAPHSSERSAVTSGSSPPLQSDTPHG